MEIFDRLPPSIGLILALLLIVWLVLALLVPFMIESIRSSNRRSLAELEEINDKLERVVELLERPAAHPAHPVPAPAEPAAVTAPRVADDDEFEDEEPSTTRLERRRKEPTI